jgi:hypothetical protein
LASLAIWMAFAVAAASASSSMLAADIDDGAPLGGAHSPSMNR